MVNPIAQSLMGPFIWGRGGAALTPEQVAREREIAEALAQTGMDYSPVGHWLEGAARAAQGLVGGIKQNRADAAEKSGKEAFASRFSNIFGGGSDVSPSLAGSPATSTAMATQPAPANAAAVTAQNTPAPRFTGGKQEFIDMMMPGAIEASRRTGIDPRIIIAQSAQETGWGKSAPGNNYFGIKSHGKGGGQTFKTHEYVDGKRVNINDSFRQYESPEDSALGYAEFIAQNPRYKPLMAAQGLDAQLEALQASGYATDPNYSRSVGAIARGIAMPEMASAADALDVLAGGQQPTRPVSAIDDYQMPGRPDDAVPYSGPGSVIDPAAVAQMGADRAAQERAATLSMMPPQLREAIDPASGVIVAETPEEILAAEQQMAGMAPPMAAPQTISDMPVADIAQSLTRHTVNPDLPMAGNTSGFAPIAQSLAQQAPAQPQYNTQDLVAAISDPWASKEQRAIATALLEQQMQANDPYRQAQLQKMNLEIEQMRNPQAKLINAGDGRLYNPNTQEWITAPDIGGAGVGGPAAFQTLHLRAEAAGLTPGTPAYQQFMAEGGRNPQDPASVQRIDRLAENLMQTGDIMDPNEARNLAVGIVDGRLKADRHPITGQLQVVDMATGRPAFQPQGQQQPTAANEMMSPVATAPSTQFGQQFPNAQGSFGLEGAAAGALNRVTDTLGLGPAYPDVAQSQADFGVLRESLLNDIASSYGRQPPSWLLKEIRDLAPEAGSVFQGPDTAKTKLNALGRHLSGELEATRSALQRDLSPTNRQEMEARQQGLVSGIGRVQTALQAFEGQQQPEQPASPQIREGQTATNPQTGEKIIFRGGKWEKVQ